MVSFQEIYFRFNDQHLTPKVNDVKRNILTVFETDSDSIAEIVDMTLADSST